MNSTSLDAPLASAQSSVPQAFSHQQVAYDPAKQAKGRKLTQFFIGLGVGPACQMVVAGFANTLAMSLFPSSLLLFNAIFGSLPLLASIILTFRKSHRFLGLGMLAGMLALAIAGVILFIVFSLMISQYCSHQEPAACG